MDSSKFTLKLLLANPESIQTPVLVPVLHSWIQTHALADHLLIDVADYDHVHNGPGIVLVSHEANYSIDDLGGTKGLSYQRKQPIDGLLAQRLRKLFRWTFDAALLLETSPAFQGVAFRTDEIILKINDRLRAPNNAETFAAIQSDLSHVANEIFGSSAQIEQVKNQPREMFEVKIRSGGGASVAMLLEHLTAATTPA